MKYLLVIILLLSSCASYETSTCRHRAVECALIYGEKVGNDNVGIAIGPTKSTTWHGQAYIKNPTTRWLVNTGNGCEIGRQEDFTPYVFMSTGEFLKRQFSWVK